MTDRITGHFPIAEDNRWFKFKSPDGRWHDVRRHGFGAWAMRHEFTIETVTPTLAHLKHVLSNGPISIELECSPEIADEIAGIQAMQNLVSVAGPIKYGPEAPRPITADTQWEIRHGELAAQHELLKTQYQEILDAAESAAKDRQALTKERDNLNAQVGELMRQRDASMQNGRELRVSLGLPETATVSEAKAVIERIRLTASATKGLRDEFAMAVLTGNNEINGLPDTAALAAQSLGMSMEEYTANNYQGYKILLVKHAYAVADAAMKQREVQP